MIAKISKLANWICCKCANCQNYEVVEAYEQIHQLCGEDDALKAAAKVSLLNFLDLDLVWKCIQFSIDFMLY